MRLNPAVVVTADVVRVSFTSTYTPSVARADCIYTARVNVAASIGPQLSTNRMTNEVSFGVPTALCTNAYVSSCAFCGFALTTKLYVTNAVDEAIGLQSRDAWQWDAFWAIKERAAAITVAEPAGELYRDNYAALLDAKAFLYDWCSYFRIPSDTNVPPAPWTRTGLAAAVGAPASWYTNSPQRGMAEQWQYVRPMLTNLYVTWISGGCATSCAPRSSLMGVHQQTITDPWNVCTNMVTWAFTSNDTCALPSAGIVVTDPRSFGTSYTLVYALGWAADCTPATWEEGFRGTSTWTSCDLSGPIYEDIYNTCTNFSECGTCDFVPRWISYVTNGPVVCGGEASACAARSSNPIGYVVPTTNYDSARVEYLAAGLPASPCAPTGYQSEAISAELSNGAWVVWSSNTASARYWCNESFVSTSAPYAGTCATNAGWAVTNAGARIIWTGFRYL